MQLYLESYTPKKAVYGSIEDGYTRFTIAREHLPEGSPPETLVMDYWGVYE